MQDFLNHSKKRLYDLLRWSEKYTKTDMVYLASGMSWLSMGQVVSSGLSFLLAIAFANLVPQETYGTYKFVLSIASILTIPTLGGINTAVTRAVARGFDGAVIEGIRARLKWGLLTTVAGLGASIYYYLNENPTLSISFIIVALLAPAMEALDLYDPLLTGKKRFDIATKYFALSHASATLVLIGTIFFTNNLFIILLAYFLPWTALRYLFFQTSIKKILSNRKTESDTIPYGKHLTLMGALGVVANNIDKVLLFHFLGPAQLAIYTFAVAIPEQIKALLKSVTNLMLPRFSARSLGEIKGGLRWKMLQFGLLATFITILYIALAPFVYRLLFPQYLESIFFSQLFSLSILTLPLFIPLSALQAHKDVSGLYVTNTIGPLAQIILIAVLGIFFGLLGVILARVFSRLIYLLLTLYLIFRN